MKLAEKALFCNSARILSSYGFTSAGRGALTSLTEEHGAPEACSGEGVECGVVSWGAIAEEMVSC